MKSLTGLILMMLMSTVGFAAEECVTINVSSFTQMEKNLMTAAAYTLAFDDGTDQSASSVNSVTGEICFTDPPFTVSTVCSQSEMEVKIQFIIDEAEPTPAKLDAYLRKISKDELTGRSPNAVINKAILTIIMREFNILRALHSLPDRTLVQLKSAISAEVDIVDLDS